MSHASREEPALRDELPALLSIIGLRNRIVHGYDEINDTLILEVLHTHRPELIRDLERTLATCPEPDDPDAGEH